MEKKITVPYSDYPKLVADNRSGEYAVKSVKNHIIFDMSCSGSFVLKQDAVKIASFIFKNSFPINTEDEGLNKHNQLYLSRLNKVLEELIKHNPHKQT